MLSYYNYNQDVTQYYLVAINSEVFTGLVTSYILGETSTFNVVYGDTRKHPKDMPNRKIARLEAQKRASKLKMTISDVYCNANYSTITLKHNLGSIDVKMYKDSGKIIIC